MSKNTVKLGIAGLTAAATGAALFTAKKVNDKKKEEEKTSTSEYRNTKRTLKVFTTLMETMKHLPAQKSQLASIIRMHIS